MNIPINDNITSAVLNLIYQDRLDKNTNLNILNISCNVKTAYTDLSSQFPNCTIYNIEMDEYYKENLEEVENTISVDVENFDLNLNDVTFDYIILDDTLQRFVDPDKVLIKLKDYLKKDGYLALSIPNFTYINSLYSYINGNFTYTDNGILNKDNVRFFTLNSFRNLMATTEYDMLSITSVAVDHTEDLDKLIDFLCTLSAPHLKDEYYSYQYIIKARMTEIRNLFDYVYN